MMRATYTQPALMKLIIILAVALGAPALAQSTPVPKIGGTCPTGTVSSGGSCLPSGNTQVYLNPSRQPCGIGWVRSGNGYYCVK